MDRVFVSSRKSSPKKGGALKQFIKKGNNRPKSVNSDTLTEYFPYAGGDGIDVHEFQPSHLSYEPAESMIESDVHIEDESPQLGRKLKRVLLRGSKYEVYDPPVDDSGMSASGSLPYPADDNPRALDAESPLRMMASTSDSGEIPEFWTFNWLNDIPTSIETAVPAIRSLAQKSQILLPLDALADKVDGIELFVAGVEIFIMMLICDQVARVVRILCRPAVFVVSLLFKLL